MITVKQETAIRDVLATMPELAVGVGTAEQASSIAALNLALTGTLTDRVPACMSVVIGRWISGVQDLMPATIRDSAAWRELLVLAAGTGREHEAERRALVLSWMWDALALVQPLANEKGYGEAWSTMLRERTVKSARAAYAGAVDAYAAASEYAAASASAAADAAAASAYEGADAASRYADADVAAAYAAAYAATAASAGPAAAAAAAYADVAAAAAYADVAAAAAYAYADVAAAYADPAAYVAAWDTIDPVGCLRRLVAVTDERALAVQPTTEGM